MNIANLSDADLLNILADDFESSDHNRWDALAEYADAETMTDEQLYVLLADDFESSDADTRYAELNDVVPFSLDGTAEDEPADTCDLISVNGENTYYFQAKPTVTEEKYDAMVYNTDTDSYEY